MGGVVRLSKTHRPRRPKHSTHDGLNTQQQQQHPRRLHFTTQRNIQARVSLLWVRDRPWSLLPLPSPVPPPCKFQPFYNNKIYMYVVRSSTEPKQFPGNRLAQISLIVQPHCQISGSFPQLDLSTCHCCCPGRWCWSTVHGTRLFPFSWMGRSSSLSASCVFLS